MKSIYQTKGYGYTERGREINKEIAIIIEPLVEYIKQKSKENEISMIELEHEIMAEIYVNICETKMRAGIEEYKKGIKNG
jgi:hypothetical protein